MMIVGLLVVDAGVAGYLLYPRDDQAPAVTGAVTRSVSGAVESQPQTDTRAIGGSVRPAQPVSPPAPRADIANNVAIAPQSAASQPESATPAPAPAPAPAPTQAQALAPAPAQSLPATAATPAPSVTPDAGQTASGRIDNAAPAAVARDRSKLQSYAQQRAQSRPQYGPRIDQTTQGRRRDDTHPNGANPVAAMLTDQLVKESSKPDPSLPMPSGVTVPMPSDNGPGPGPSVGRGSTNPVASAMTDKLVRESSKVGPTQPPAEPPILTKP
ncbi:hypothetical protein [Paraburkholderia atlantica]|uniref:hypothetical protein n=1 Tax=Paraburkholderia atlantica TaxID=2654982 RepID=UPI00184C136A|nr:hypothetical protein [Paraburkholderia atlantica]MBB5418056.1 pyruvate/2-oxoglutarate dehydrogenase complex dihydrolipoamide acyltransferase (E2) component [Paraburkholderia atlantica]